MFIVIFGSYPFQQLDTKLTPFHFGLFEGLGRVIWAIALCYVIFACVHGYGGPINRFLAHPFWQPISKLSYSIYLLHLPVIWLTMATTKSPLYFSELTAVSYFFQLSFKVYFSLYFSFYLQFHAFFGNYILSIFVSAIATLAFEQPVLMIEKLIFGDVAKTELDVNNKKQNGFELNGTKSNESELNGQKRNGYKKYGFKQNQTEILLKLLKKHEE